MSSLTGSMGESDSLPESRASVSDSHESYENEAPLEREEEVTEEHMHRVQGGYKSVLKS